MISTDDLVVIIVTKIGIPLPVYDYSTRKFLSRIPINVSDGNGGVVGTYDELAHDTFNEACQRLVDWYNANYVR